MWETLIVAPAAEKHYLEVVWKDCPDIKLTPKKLNTCKIHCISPGVGVFMGRVVEEGS